MSESDQLVPKRPYHTVLTTRDGSIKGTFGLVLKDPESGQAYGVTSAALLEVAAGEPVYEQSAAGDLQPVGRACPIQPTQKDASSVAARVGIFELLLDVEKNRLFPSLVARPDDALGIRVDKVGATSGLTSGEVSAVNSVIHIDGRGQFYGAIEIESKESSPFAELGDGGALVTLHADGAALGVVVGGSLASTFVAPLSEILQRSGLVVANAAVAPGLPVADELPRPAFSMNPPRLRFAPHQQRPNPGFRLRLPSAPDNRLAVFEDVRSVSKQGLTDVRKLGTIVAVDLEFTSKRLVSVLISQDSQPSGVIVCPYRELRYVKVGAAPANARERLSWSLSGSGITSSTSMKAEELGKLRRVKLGISSPYDFYKTENIDIIFEAANRFDVYEYGSLNNFYSFERNEFEQKIGEISIMDFNPYNGHLVSGFIERVDTRQISKVPFENLNYDPQRERFIIKNLPRGNRGGEIGSILSRRSGIGPSLGHFELARTR